MDLVLEAIAQPRRPRRSSSEDTRWSRPRRVSRRWRHTLGFRVPGDVHRPRRTGAGAGAFASGDHSGAAEPGLSDLDALHLAAEAVRVHGCGTADRRVRPAGDTRGAAPRRERAAGEPVIRQRSSQGIRAVACRRRAGGTARRNALNDVDDYTWSRRAERLEALFEEVRGASMISDRLLSLVRCPGCHVNADGGPGHSHDVAVYELRTASTRRRRSRTSWTCVRASNSRNRPSISTRRCTPTRGTNAYRRRCSGRRSATTCCARSSALVPAIGWSISAAAADARCCGTATGAPRPSASTSPRSSPKSRGGRCDLLLGDLRRLPFADGTFTKAYSLDVLEHLSPEALRGMLGEAAAFSRRAARCSSTPTSARTRRSRQACAGSTTPARALERLGLIDMRQERLRKSDHLNPLADIPELERVASDGGFRIERIRYYTPIVGGFVENILMRVAESGR